MKSIFLIAISFVMIASTQRQYLEADHDVSEFCCPSCGSSWEAYRTVIPLKRHRAVGKDSGQTNHIERFNCTLRQRISRLVQALPIFL
jgi:IS1 family transposase